MSINLVPEHALPKSYYFDAEASVAENYVNAKQIASEAAETILLVTPIEESSAQIPPPASPIKLGV
jgi:hypothetical protein